MRMRPSITRPALALAAAGSLLLTSACTLAGGGGGSADDEGADGGGTVTLVTHDSFALPDDVVADFEERSGYTLETVPQDTLANQLILTRDQPLGDVAYGVDNTIASRALDEGVFAPYAPDAPAGVADLALPGDDEGALSAVDTAGVCVNVDDDWFAEQDLAPPTSFEDLTDPRYRGLFVTPSASRSTPGLAFLLATIAEFGDDWPDYWRDLLTNDALVVKGWSEAYNGAFTAGGGEGERPIVLSYDSSPAFTVDGDRTTTSALLDTCFRQVEYVGVLEGAENVEGAQAVVDFLLSEPVQAALPTSMYVFPAASDVALPTDWAAYAEQPAAPLELDPAEIAENRDDWLREWGDLVAE